MKEVSMELDNHKILYSITQNNNMGIIVNNGLKNQTVRELCTHSQNKSYAEIKKYRWNFLDLLDTVSYLKILKILINICYYKTKVLRLIL